MELQKIINEEDTILIDVREIYEYEEGHANGAINIPLGSIPTRLEELRAKSGTLIVYCRSGMRSAQAMGWLRAQGIKNVYNGGSVDDVVFYQKQTA